MSQSEAASGTADVEDAAPSSSDAFAALADDVRTTVLEALSDRAPQSFSELCEAAPVDTTAGFAYHLRQLDGQYVRKSDDGYRLTYAGRQAARAVRAGTYTERTDFGPVDLDEPCPLCGDGELEAACADNYVTVGCRDCRGSILTLPLAPGASADDPQTLLDRFDRHHRYRLSLMSDGVCPECGASMDARIDRCSDEERPPDQDDPHQVALSCPGCGCQLTCPITLAVLEHPAVVSFYHDHGLDVRDRPIWNVGEEWSETVLSEEPWCVRVAAQLDDELLELLVGRDLTVVETERTELG